MCVCCLSKLVRHIYAMSMDSFGLHLHREIISCIAMPIHLSATPTPVHTNTHTRTQLICLFLWHIQGKSALLPRAESQKERARDVHKSLSMCAQIHTSKFHFRFAFVFPFTLCFPFRAMAKENTKQKAQRAFCQVLSNCFVHFWLGHGINNAEKYGPSGFPTIPHSRIQLFPSSASCQCMCQKCLLAGRIN